MNWLNRVHFGDCRESMRAMIADGVRVQMCVTSPPYWGLRDYGVAGQLGLESTPQEYVSHMVEVFRLARDLLADDGTLWLNLGDSYAAGGQNSGSRPEDLTDKQRSNAGCRYARRKAPDGLKPKDLVGIPWRVAFALQADGWYLRSDIIWHKPNPMPESVTDRPTKSHEYIFLLTKSERYYYNAEAIAEPMTSGDTRRPYAPGVVDSRGNGHDRDGGSERTYTKPYTGTATKDFAAGGAQDASATKARIVERILSGEIVSRNKRSVWTVTTKPYAGAHFATFPPDLIEPCILAGSRPGDVVFDPFMGSGTTAQVAQAFGRNYIGCELNRDYEPLQRDRTRQMGMAL